MFKKAFSGKSGAAASPSSTSAAGSGSGSGSGYAFSSPQATSSPNALRKKENETFYQPLPAPPSDPLSTPNPSGSRSASYSNSFSDSPGGSGYSTPRQLSYAQQSNNNSPNVNSSLLAGASPIDPSSRFSNNMPTPQRFGPGSRSSSGMPPRGDSQSALLGGNGDRGSATRRYGPTASSAPIGANAALLGSPAQSDKPLQNDNPWAAGIDTNPEADDYLHNPDPKRDRRNDRGGSIFTARGFVNIGCLGVLMIGIITLFAGYPIITFYTDNFQKTEGAYNLGGINSTGQVPQIDNFPSLIDTDTPQSAMTRTGFDGEQYSLVFSDEFNKDGRTFFPGDDPYWTGVDLHYWPTGDFEWYDPSAITTKDGNLVITMTQEPIHDLNFKSGMLQSWNQLCFQYSIYIEARVSLPGTYQVGGFWPGVWTMGNLGRPGYGATTEGLWPYTYDACDLGTLKNQTNADGNGPAAALVTGQDGTGISYLPGQRTSACTCSGEDHPGPSNNIGRGVPEVDVIEAQTDLSIPRGQMSQSFQVAPFDDHYQYQNTTPYIAQYDTDITIWNSYKGGPYQEAVSSLTYVNNDVYQLTGGNYGVYGYELYADPNNRESGGHITWVSEGKKSWTMNPSSVGPNSKMGISQRLIPEEPMAMVINFGMSNNFQTVNFNDLTWPAHMLVDYVRVYQRSEGAIGCDPKDHPTANYIAAHSNAYNNPNLTTWDQAGYTFPKNSMIDKC